MNLYKKVWADIFHIRKKKRPNENYANIAKSELMFYSIITSFNLATLLIWIDYCINKYSFQLELDLFPSTLLVHRIASSALLFYIPSLILNYFLICFNGKYLKIIEKYPYRNGKLARYYSLGSIAVFVISAIVLGILKRI